MSKLYVVGIGPGGKENMTLRAVKVIKSCDVIVGYTPYVEYLGDLKEGKEVFSTGMGGELDRCKTAIKKVKEGKNTAIVSTGDAGLYGMAGPILEMSKGIDVEIVPGITSAFSAASELGCPIMHDFCCVSLSDYLTSWDLIKERVECACRGDFVIAIYNPKSKSRPKHIKEAINIMLKYKLPTTPVGIVQNSGRKGTKKLITTLEKIDYNIINMMSIVIVGNSNTYIRDGLMITPRGYQI